MFIFHSFDLQSMSNTIDSGESPSTKNAEWRKTDHGHIGPGAVTDSAATPARRKSAQLTRDHLKFSRCYRCCTFVVFRTELYKNFIYLVPSAHPFLSFLRETINMSFI